MAGMLSFISAKPPGKSGWRGAAVLLAVATAFLTVSCSSRSGHRSTVLQGGIAPPEETTPGRLVAAPDPPPEVSSTGAGDTAGVELSAAAAEDDAAIPAPMDSPAPPAPRAETSPMRDIMEAAAPVVIPEEREPVPELIGPEDDRIIEEIESARESVPPVSPPPPRVEYDIPIEQHVKVLDYIELFQTSRRRSFLRGLSRSKIYEEIAIPILREEGVPTDLYYLALIESAFNPRAYSRAKAMGIWQFIYTTGRAYGLDRTHWIDERRDPVKATRAAARHLKDLHDDLGSWPLALAGYNAGVNRVKRAIAKAGTRDFWKLRLPAQTRHYVPAFYAAVIIGKDPEAYGFSLDYLDPVSYETVKVDGGTRLSLVASFCGTSVQKIRDINPEIRQGCAPPGRDYTLNIPPGTNAAVVAGLAKTPRSKITGWGSYEIRSGDTLSAIARRFGTTVPAIQEVNNLPGHFIKAGDTIMIPGSTVADGSIPRVPHVETAVPSSGTYRVRRGDSLWSIARRYGLSLERITSLNGLVSSDILSIGQVLRLRPPSGGTRVASAAPPGTPPRAFFYRVRKGDNLWKIARKFDADLQAIMRVNQIDPGRKIFPGDQLIIPGGTF